MREGPDIVVVAALIGDPARAAMLTALMSGQALTAGELAAEAGVTPQTASAHLAKLSEAGLLLREVQGRHRYVRLASPDVAAAIEGLMQLAGRIGRPRARPGPRDEAMRRARICYDHLAGEAGVRLHDALVGAGLIVATLEGLGVSPAGRTWLLRSGIRLAELEAKSRPLCRACLDWSERRHHLAGSLGAALLDLILRKEWALRDPKSRAILFSQEGSKRFEALLELPNEKRLRRQEDGKVHEADDRAPFPVILKPASQR